MMKLRSEKVVCLMILLLWAPPRTRAEGADMSLNGKIIAGYQGWFGCRGENGAKEFSHWQEKNTLAVPMLPDVSEYPETALCHLDVKLSDDAAVSVFSSANKAITEVHVGWMSRYGIDTFAMQRFVSRLKDNDNRTFMDSVLLHMAAATASAHRKIYIEYDLSGSSPSDTDNIVNDWNTQFDRGLLKNICYQFHHNKPVVELWGLGFQNRRWTPDSARTLMSKLRASKISPTIILGIPSYWRTSQGDADADHDWLETYKKADMISPWTVSRYSTRQETENFFNRTIKPDLTWSESNGVEYLPVIFPGTSSPNHVSVVNPSNIIGHEVSPRDHGRLFQQQINEVEALGTKYVFIAMFDELNEGTAIMKAMATIDGVKESDDAYLLMTKKLSTALEANTQ